MSVSTDKRTGSDRASLLRIALPSSIGMSVSCLESIGLSNKFVMDTVESCLVLILSECCNPS